MDRLQARVETRGVQAGRVLSASRRAPIAALCGVFVAAAFGTTLWCRSMSAMGEVPMPGGWSMSTIWMPMCGRTWAQTGAAFVGMWTVMMMAMMVPSLAPSLLRYWEDARRTSTGTAVRLACCLGVSYFVAWAALGAAAFAADAPLAAGLLRSGALARHAPVLSGSVMLVAGFAQFTGWKARRLACCRISPRHGITPSMTMRGASGAGLRLALDCGCCCANLMAVTLAAGIMDVRVMAAVTAALNAERLAPACWRAREGVGYLVIAAGCCRLIH